LILPDGNLILTTYPFFYMKIRSTVIFLALKILSMNPGQSKDDKTELYAPRAAGLMYSKGNLCCQPKSEKYSGNLNNAEIQI